MTALEASGLSYRAGSRHLVEDVSISIQPGERLAIVGPNGAGKTTLMRILSGSLRPHAGTVRLFGEDLSDLRPIARAKITALVGQSDHPDGRVRLWDYVGLGRVPHSGARSKADEWGIIRSALSRVGLEGLRDRELGTLSGGERQRAQIARALAQEPKLLFLDEPTNHLDPRARGDLLQLVAGLDLTVVAILHDLPLVPAFATHVAVMAEGRVVAHGTVEHALSQDVVRRVFALDVLRIRHPEHDRDLTVFETPLQQAQGAVP